MTDPSADVSGRSSRPLKVLAVTNLWPEDGSFRGVFVREQVESLRRLGHVVDVEVINQTRGKRDYVLAAGRIRRRASGFDVVHVHYGLSAFAARFVGPPRVLSLYGSDVNDRRQFLATRLGWGGYAARIYVSSRLARAAGDAAPDVIANGVDFTTFTPGDRSAARTELGIRPEEYAVLFGALPTNSVKGYDIYADVLAELRGRGLAVRELVLSAPNQSLPAVVAKLNAADVLLFTSRRGSEGSPTVVKEAATVGLPVVTVDVGDVGEILAGVSPSAVVPFAADDDRAALITALADQTAAVLAAGVRSNGRGHLQWLDSPAVAQRVVDVYRRVIAK